MRQYPHRLQPGFSLMEFLVAVAIISIILGMALLNYGSILPNFKANSAMDQLLYQLRSARERAIAHRREVQVQFVGTNQLTITEIWLLGTAPPASTVSFAVYFGGLSGGPPIMKFSTTGALIDGGNTVVNGTVFMGIPGKPSTARAISILGATGRVREYHWDGSQWQE